MKISDLLTEEISGTTSAAVAPAKTNEPIKGKSPIKRIKQGQFSVFGLGEAPKKCRSCGIKETEYNTMGSRRVHATACPECGKK